MTQHYAAGEEAEAQKAFVGLNWVLTESHLDVETELALGFLDYLLLGTAAAPLRKVCSRVISALLEVHLVIERVVY